MATRKLLVLIDNVPGELPIGDNVDLTFTAPETFSYKKINSGKILTIPAGQQMAVHGQIESIDGELIIDGELVII